jgi:hypothetical protein
LSLPFILFFKLFTSINDLHDEVSFSLAKKTFFIITFLLIIFLCHFIMIVALIFVDVFLRIILGHEAQMMSI